MEKDEVQEIQIVNKENHPKLNIATSIVSIICTLITAVAAVVGVFVVNQAIVNTNQQKQTQVVIEPREGDIIVKEGDDYKLLQLININDIVFPTKVQEVQIKASESNGERVPINNIYNEDWSNRDSFKYIINSFSINSNKIIIDVYCDFYIEKNIATFVDLSADKAFTFNMWTRDGAQPFEITKTNEGSKKEYVTKEINDGIEWVKIRVKIIYEIEDKEIIDTLTSDWIETDADFFG